MTATRRVFLLYGLSGLLSLGYQVVWFRTYVDRFGSTNLTFALVLCAFLAGLAAGSLASRPVANLIRRRFGLDDPLRVYGAVELLVTAAVLLTFASRLVPADAWGTFPYVLHDGVHVPTWSVRISRIAIGAVSVFAPCFFMGVTFPLLCNAFRHDGRFPSALYAWNTAGACTGVLACQFVFLPWIGHDVTLSILAAINLLLGGFFLIAGGAGRASPAAAADRPPRPDGAGRAAVLVLAVLSGFVAGSIEGDLFKRIGFLVGEKSAVMSFVSFWAILAIFLASFAVRSFARIGLPLIRVAWVFALSAHVVLWSAAYRIINAFLGPARDRVTDALERSGGAPTEIALDFPTNLAELFVFVGLFVFPTYFAISLLLPYVCNRVQGAGRHLGLAYGLNTVAFCAGLVAFTWIAPRVSIFYSLKLAFVVFAVGVALLAFLSDRRPLKALPLWTAAAALFLGCALTPRGFDATYVTPHGPSSRFPVRAMKSNGAHTTYVVADPDGDRLYFNNYSMSATSPSAQVYMRLMAHFPLLSQESPEKALLICFGVGNTASAIASHESIRRIDVVDLNPQVFATAPEFAAYNDRVYEDPRVRFVADDGRNFLNASADRYDLVTSEPPPPMLEGVYRLYSREYYESVLAHLTPDGIMTQWIPVYQMPPAAVDLAVRTFADVFPDALLFTGFGEELILAGSAAPIDLRRIVDRFGTPGPATEDLRRLGIRDPVQMIARVMKSDAALRRDYGTGRTIGDRHNDLAYLFLDPAARARVTYDPRDVLRAIGERGIDTGGKLGGVLTHLGRLRYHVPGFPIGSLATVAGTGADLPLANADWTRIGAILDRYREAKSAGDVSEAIRLLGVALGEAEEQPEILLDLATEHLSVEQYEAAVPPLRRFLLLEPGEAIGYGKMGVARSGLGDYARAEQLFRHAVDLDPGEPDLRYNLGSALAILGRYDEAVRELREATRLAPQNPDARYQLGVALTVLGRLDDAIEAFEDATRLAPDDPASTNALARSLALHPDPDRRDPERAVRLATRAVELTERRDAAVLDTLAAAHASAGDLDLATAVAEEAADLATEQGADELAARIRQRLEGYR